MNRAMRFGGRHRSVVFFVVLGVCLVALALTLNVGWILLNWRQVTLLVLGVIFFVAIIAGLILNTAFLVHEIRRNERHDSFINAVTHELKTPIASIRLYLETLQTRPVDEARRREFYGVMLADTDRLLRTVEQVLRAGRTGDRSRQLNASTLDLGQMVRECVDLTRTRYHLTGDSIRFAESPGRGGGRAMVRGDPDELRAAIFNLLDNAIKYSDKETDVRVEVVRSDSERVAVRVSDRGIGIPPGELRHIFKRFYRVPRRMIMRV
ncbi:MAG: HAMP domain-containing histidine kinase, partial [Acidobacteria bacterium]|nr:HAMP domain-containing histidine kinase [Acidobacteriota bacterium]